ncbi:aminoglycoside phosphotransferase family protein [Salinibacillus xinjiangensis]|uniref:Hydrogenase expression protein HypB n=1 Tax=Salinibacillus xinjiangensis TaxID=1229268 RepID=A0A6G1X4C8_9BACI|nr:aminoglycoside phosphotransferase family protein [Salinibacillus xinjiangensis]MRG85779.1 hydrogenase expression protein HypB [Salinibacillus xinjiangensis]
MKLQEQFVKSVRLYFQEKGEAWLKELPNLIEFCEQNWSLKLQEPYSLSVNYVAPAVRNDGKEVVVKICIPGEGFLDELEALRLYKGKGMVRLIDFDQNYGILLLEKLSPGITLAKKIDCDEEACQIAAKVMQKLSTPAPAHTRIPTTKIREENLRNIIKRHPDGLGPISKKELKKALHIFTYLNETMQKPMLLHGDFHHYNILASGEEEWTAIDPKGLIGEVEYDLIQFMLNKLPDYGMKQLIAKRVEIFTNELNLNKERLLLWGYCHTVLATAWTVDGEEFEENFYQGISVFKQLFDVQYGKL